ncbi:MAG: cytochrome P450, partial [Myxococcota bacterium]
MRFARDPITTLDRWRAKYGDPFTIPAINGDVVTTGRPELIHAIFAAAPHRYAPFGVQALEPVVGPHSILIQQGRTHLRQRRLLMPPFHGERMRTYAEIFAEVTRTRAHAAKGQTSMLALAQAISLDVIIRAVFGIEEVDRPEVEQIVVSLTRATSPLLLFIPALQRSFGGWGPYARLRRALDRTDAMLQARIETARSTPGGQDILSLLLQTRDENGEPMSDGEIRDHLRTLLFAGHETSAITLAWAVDLLLRHPEILQTLKAELEADANSPWLAATVNETLRLYPAVTEALRALCTPMTIDRWTLPEGAVVAPSIHLLHRNPDVYDEPSAFRPDRFVSKKPNPQHFIPFGGGHRRCIGAAFAQYELGIALRTLITEFDLKLVHPRPPRVVRRNITLGPSDGVP